MSRLIGIDLGCVRSRVAVFEDGSPRLIPDAVGRPATSSVVAFPTKGEPLVGEAALREALLHPGRVVFGVKRLLGLTTDAAELAAQAAFFTQPLTPGPDGEVRLSIEGIDTSPTAVASLLLAHLRRLAEHDLGEAVEEAVLGVPSGFGRRRRSALREAARLAGLAKVRLVDETALATLRAMVAAPPADGALVAAYGLGGGCFEVSILDATQGLIEVRATAGDPVLGGMDLEAPLVAGLARELREATGLDVETDPRLRLRLRAAAEKARFSLADADETEVTVALPHGSEPARFVTRLTWKRADELTRDALERTAALSRRCLADAGVDAERVTRVLPVGGTTRDRRVRGVLQDLFPAAVVQEIEPDGCVALGAAVMGATMTGQVEDVTFLGVVAHTLGLETPQGELMSLIDRNSTIPTRKRQPFTTSVDGQTTATLHFLEGESDRIADDESLGRFELRGLVAAPAGRARLEVGVEVDVGDRAYVWVEERGSPRRWIASLDGGEAHPLDGLSGIEPLVPVTDTNAPPLAPGPGTAPPPVDLAPGAPCSLGILAGPDGFVPFVRRHQTLPARAVGLFTATAESRTGVQILLLTRLPHTAAGRARRLGTLVLTGLRPAARGRHRIEVAVAVDVDGGVSVTARDEATGLRQSMALPSIVKALAGSVEIETRVGSGGLALLGVTAPSGEPTAVEVERMRREEENRRFRSWDQERAVIEQTEAMVANVTRALDELGGRLGDEDRTWILAAVQRAEATLARRRLGEGTPDELDDRFIEVQAAVRLVGKGFLEP